MAPNQQAMDLHVDEVALTDYEKLIPLLESIYVCAVWGEVCRLCMMNCLGCELVLLSQNDHDCLMLLDEEKWETYGEDAAEIVNNEQSILEQFIEAIRVLRLPFHKDV